MTTETPQSPAQLFEGLYAENFASVRNFLFSRCGDWQLSEDLAQDVFTTLWQQLSEGKALPEDHKPFSVLARRAQNALYRHRRLSSTSRELLASPRYDTREAGRQVETPIPAAAAESVPPVVEDVAIERFQVGAALAMLKPVQRRAVALRYMEDLPDHEVARQTGYSARTVKLHTSTALNTLRAAFGIPVALPAGVVADRREQARAAYRASVASGEPMTLTMVAKQFGRSLSWARLVIRESGDYQPREADRDRVVNALRDELSDGKYAPGERMPTCEVLAGRFGVCSGTASWALRQLTAEGWLERRESACKRETGFYATTHMAEVAA